MGLPDFQDILYFKANGVMPIKRRKMPSTKPLMSKPLKKTIAFLLYPDFQSLDCVGPLDALHIVNQWYPDSYRILLISLDGKSVESESHLKMQVDKNGQWQGKIDTLIVPGGRGARKLCDDKVYQQWLTHKASKVRRLVSVCTGVFFLGAAGLVNGKTITTHWAHAAEFAQRFPKVKLNSDAIYLQQNHIYTSAGITSGIDLALKLIEEDFDKKTSIKVARQLVVYFHRPGHQAQFSAPLAFQEKAHTGFDDLSDYMLQNLHKKMDVAILADFCNMSHRNFQRKFKAHFQTTPINYLKNLRLEQARQWLEESQLSIEKIAERAGFDSTSGFRRAFLQRFDVSPQQYSRLFGLIKNDSSIPL
ncbi:MAG: GlxA family transcriptional regulator [Pseudomonadota bacterium]